MKKGEIPLQFLDPRPQLEQYSSEGKKTGWGSAADFPLPRAVLYTPLPPPPLFLQGLSWLLAGKLLLTHISYLM